MASETSLPKTIETEFDLDLILSEPTPGAIESVSRMKGDLLVLGVAGKMGPTLARMAKRAADSADNPIRVIGVSRFSNPQHRESLEECGVETIACDLLAPHALDELPDAANVLYMAGWKFGSTGQEGYLWAMNAFLPGLVAERYKNSRIVAFSTGNVYPFTPNDSGGPTESHTPAPVGEYAQSCLGRERMFEYASDRNGTLCAIVRLNYAVELRYGVLCDVAQKVFEGIPIPLKMGYVNVIWQGDANAQTLQCFDLCAAPPKIMNVTGAETLSVRQIARQFGERFGKEPLFEGAEEPTSLLNNASQALERFGPPRVSINRLIEWIAGWIEIGGSTLNKPTHFEGREGKY